MWFVTEVGHFLHGQDNNTFFDNLSELQGKSKVSETSAARQETLILYGIMHVMIVACDHPLPSFPVRMNHNMRNPIFTDVGIWSYA